MVKYLQKKLINLDCLKKNELKKIQTISPDILNKGRSKVEMVLSYAGLKLKWF
jgi:hypothetical protein